MKFQGLELMILIQNLKNNRCLKIDLIIILLPKYPYFFFIFLSFFQIPRFCPTAPGSSVYHPPTSLQNPGPGQYYKKPLWGDIYTFAEKTRKKYKDTHHKDLILKPQVHSASIPSKKIS
jgi:hypothetical protein